MAISATSLFASTTTESIFATTTGAQAPAAEALHAQTVIRAQRRQINQIKGYKLELTPADNQRLSKIKAEIVDIEKRAAASGLDDSDVAKRIDLLADADEIIGKPTADVEADDELAEYAGLIEAVLSPRLDGVTERRLETLQRVKDGMIGAIARSPKSKALQSQFQSVVRQMSQLKPLRSPGDLSASESKVYDDIAELINDHVGAKIQLSARDSKRVADLEASILDLQAVANSAGINQASSQAVTRAYGRLLNA